MANITFVDDQDNVIGAGSIDEVNEKNIRHRIVRIFLTNDAGDILLQKRAAHILTNPGKWDQSAAGHVDEGESYEHAAYRELEEELGITGVPLTEIGYYYVEEIVADIQKRRFNRIYTGKFNGVARPNPEEVSDIKWISKAELDALCESGSEDFTKGCLYAFRFVRKLL